MHDRPIAIEHKGRYFLFNEPIESREAWFIAKNRNADRNYASIWATKHKYGVSYSDNVEKAIKEMVNELYIKEISK